MRLLSSLRSRIFLTSALLAVLAIGAAIYLVNVRVARETEQDLARQLVSASELVVDQLQTSRTQTTLMARLIADLPKLKAAVETDDPATVRDIAGGYQQQLHSHLLLVTNRSGNTLAAVAAPGSTLKVDVHGPAVRDALAGRETSAFVREPLGVLQVVTVPILLGVRQPELLGTLSVGFLLDGAQAEQVKRLTGSDVAFSIDGAVVASTLAPEAQPRLAALLQHPGTSDIRVDTQDYVALPRHLADPTPGHPVGSAPGVIVLRSRTEQLRFVQAIHTSLAATGVVAVLLATLLSFAVASTITRPLAAITAVMREVAATGDLTRKIALRPSGGWEDEDARLLAATFNTLTESVGRFQREVSQKERLSALGRLSTVVAHEVRNPLMIIKASLHGLTRPDVSPESIREACADINEEIARLNRLVNDVLDFARPVAFTLAPVDIHALCKASAAAAATSGPGVSIALALADTNPTVMADGDRLRLALVNMLVNAQHAVEARRAAGQAPADRADSAPAPPVELRTEVSEEIVRVTIADTGAGIQPADLARVFDPFFTTKRGGTGLGLAITKNVIEGLGGSIDIDSTPGLGTTIRIELPLGERTGQPS